ncbi:hypothetical protein RRG08_033975 [Elysia crispata]|uniref:Uncharacterized protein n=1 Tax=Elysia crispata TaxID=231223 RepID=A0AAE0YS25_9GAST|nr:hypothetical protein RRG08_033975 [Elysia crispata]
MGKNDDLLAIWIDSATFMGIGEEGEERGGGGREGGEVRGGGGREGGEVRGGGGREGAPGLEEGRLLGQSGLAYLLPSSLVQQTVTKHHQMACRNNGFCRAFLLKTREVVSLSVSVTERKGRLLLGRFPRIKKHGVDESSVRIGERGLYSGRQRDGMFKAAMTPGYVDCHQLIIGHAHLQSTVVRAESPS